MATHEEIQAAAGTLREAISVKLGGLADQVLGRPEFGSSEWTTEWKQRDSPLGRARLKEWHLVKMQIARAAGTDQTGDVINARGCGASWAEIGQACGITRQAAHDRWAKLAPAKVTDRAD